jgi:hypothetical protein
MRILRHAVLSILIVSGLLASAPGAAASTHRITRGEAQAAFEAFWTAGFTIDNKAPSTTPAFADVHYILFNITHEDSPHYCTLDWFAYGIGWAWVGSQQEAAADRDAVQVSHEIDGRLVDYKVTAAKRVITFGDVWGWIYGALVPPGSLPIGEHTLTTTVVDPLVPADSFTGTVTFFIDADGTGACL